jgi:hypothetical protein
MGISYKMNVFLIAGIRNSSEIPTLNAHFGHRLSDKLGKFSEKVGRETRRSIDEKLEDELDNGRWRSELNDQ